MSDATTQNTPLAAITSATKPVEGEQTLPAALVYVFAFLILLLDQGVKWWASTKLQMMGTMPVIPGVFHFTYTENRGMAFSLLEGQRVLLIGSAVVVVAGIVWAQQRIGKRLPVSLALALALALGGALGNLTDRARLGYVVDLFDARVIRFPIFNVADTAITFGILLLAWRVATAPAPPAETEREPVAVRDQEGDR